jgi:hypothetical protein
MNLSQQYRIKKQIKHNFFKFFRIRADIINILVKEQK